MLILLGALAGAGTVHAGADDMFGMMFRMMLTMMNVMSDAMQNNNNGWGNNNWTNNLGGGLNSFNVGMSTWPMMSGFSSPFSSFGNSPFNSFGMSPWSAVSPWSGMISPWSLPLGGNPWGNASGGGYPFTNPAMLPGIARTPFANSAYGYPPVLRRLAPGSWNHGALPWSGSLLDGRWFGSSGEILDIQGNRFRLQQGKVGLNGAITVENDIVSMYSPQTNTLTRYTFMRNQSGLLLEDASGNLLRFTNKPVNGIVHVF